MKCVRCGVENEHPRMHPIRNDNEARFDPSHEAPVSIKLSAFWRCTTCGRDHFADGTGFDPKKVQT